MGAHLETEPNPLIEECIGRMEKGLYDLSSEQRMGLGASEARNLLTNLRGVIVGAVGVAMTRHASDAERERDELRMALNGTRAGTARRGRPIDSIDPVLRVEHPFIAVRLLNVLAFLPGGDQSKGTVAEVGAKNMCFDLVREKGMGRKTFRALLDTLSARGVPLACGCTTSSPCPRAVKRRHAQVAGGTALANVYRANTSQQATPITPEPELEPLFDKTRVREMLEFLAKVFVTPAPRPRAPSRIQRHRTKKPLGPSKKPKVTDFFFDDYDYD